MTYHTVIFPDYYLTNPVKDFHASLPYTIGDPNYFPAEAIDDIIPDQFYSKEESLTNISTFKRKCKRLIKQTPMEKLTSGG